MMSIRPLAFPFPLLINYSFLPLCFLLLISSAIIQGDGGGGNENDGGNDNNAQLDSGEDGTMDGANLTIATFLDGLSKQGRNDLMAIFANKNSLTKDEMNKQLDAWAAKQKVPKNFPTIYTALKNAYEDVRSEFDARHAQLMASPNVTDEVRAADQKIRAIANNQFITPIEEANQIAAAMASFPPNVQAALKAAAPYPIQVQPPQGDDNGDGEDGGDDSD